MPVHGAADALSIVSLHHCVLPSGGAPSQLATDMFSLKLHPPTLTLGMMPVILLLTLVALYNLNHILDMQGLTISQDDSSKYFRSIEYIIPQFPDDEIEWHVQLATDVRGNITPSPLENCTVTNQVRLEINATGHWLLHSLHNGEPKHVGGDDFYVTYEDYADPNYDMVGVSPTAVANVSHVGNGTYYLDFLEPPMRKAMLSAENRHPYRASGMGKVTIHFVYTCSIGYWDFASKRRWWANGSSRAVHVQHNVSIPGQIHPFRLPTLLDRQTEDKLNLGTYDNVACYGDSVMRGFCGTSHDYCPEDYHKTNMISLPNHRMSIGRRTLSQFLKTLENHFLRDSRLWNNTNDALILSSCAWDLLQPKGPYPDLDEHMQTLRTVLATIRETRPNLTLYWKSAQALHAQVLNAGCFQSAPCRNRGLFMSNHYVQNLHQRQTELMSELGIPIIDVFEMSLFSPEWHTSGDGVHYQVGFNYAMLNLMYPLDYPENRAIECNKDR